MTLDQPTAWQAGSTAGSAPEVMAAIRKRLVGVVAALVIQASIALLGVLPELPRSVDPARMLDAYGYTYAAPPASFWIQFTVLALIAAVVVSLALHPSVHLADVPLVGKLVLGLGFVVMPALAIALGGIDAAQAAAPSGLTGLLTSWLEIGFFATLFFGLPALALAARPSQDVN